MGLWWMQHGGRIRPIGLGSAVDAAADVNAPRYLSAEKPFIANSDPVGEWRSFQ
jgi:hypothetical protein